MCQRIFRLVTCSRSRLSGTDLEMRAQLGDLLRSARRNNARAGVTGALFFNTVFFAQALEGDYVAVQRVLERLQHDTRHNQLTILHCGFTAGRAFGDWSMAFTGTTAAVSLPFGNNLGQGPEFTGTSPAGDRVLQFLRDNVVRAETWAFPEPLWRPAYLPPDPVSVLPV